MKKKSKNRIKTIIRLSLACLLLAVILMVSQMFPDLFTGENPSAQTLKAEDILMQIPEYSGQPYVEINGNIPDFSSENTAAESWESYSDLDRLGRCGAAFASIGRDRMPPEERQSIGMIRPSGWHTVRYDDIVEGKYLYNRCHLIAYQLTGQNANELNLITGTRYMNTVGMQPFENQVAEYVRTTGNHVLYRVTPIFKGSELVARGVQMEALSVEDSGKGLCFNVFIYNVQPGIIIDYATGESRRA